MQIKTSGIVLHSVRYSDSANIITMYTRQFGRVAYMVYGVNKKKSVCRAALLQPLSLVEMDVFHVPGKDIQRIKEMRIEYPFTGIPYDAFKNAIALFVSEVLFRTLRQTEYDENLYLFLENSIQQLDCCADGISNFHLVFLLKLTRYLGIEPNRDPDAKTTYFDLLNGTFLVEKPLHSHYVMPEIADDIAALLQTNYANMHNLTFSRKRRMEILEATIEYFKLHVTDFHNLFSLNVLKNLFD
jgi:DNA repair protein RecO (recombination protein O)